MKTKYPKMTCTSYNEEYNGRREAWMRDAINEYMVNDAIEDKGGDPLFSGPMQCFCIAEQTSKHKKSEYYELKNN